MTFPIEKLSNLCLKITDGSHNPPKGIEEGAYLMLSSKNIYDDLITFDSPRFLTERDFKIENKRTEVSSGDVLLTIVGTIGRCAVVEADTPKFCLQRSVAVLKPNSEKILSRFLMYSLMSMSKTLNTRARGVAQKGIYLETLRDLSIKVPPLSIQKKVIQRLDLIFSKIDKALVSTSANAKNTDDLFQKYLSDVFQPPNAAWSSSTLDELAKFIDYRGKTPTKTSDGIRLITAKNVKFGYLKNEPYEFIATEDYEKWMTRGIPKKGDVLFTTEAPLANVAQLDTDDKVVFAQRLIILQSKKEKIANEFLKYALLSKPVQKEIISKGTGATVKGIKASLLKLIKISYPYINEQKEICARLDRLRLNLEQLKASYLEKNKNIESLKQSILYQAFNRNLVKDW